jgi:hypothetical protein
MQNITYRVDSPSVIYEQFDGELVAIHLETGAYHSLFGTSADSFLLLTQEASAQELAEVLQTKYDATAEAIGIALIPFLDALKAEQLIAVVDAPAARGPLQLDAPDVKLPFTPPTLQAYHDLQALFLLDPVHEVGEQGWPQTMHATEPGDPTAA